ncbi:Uncharacterised protein [Acinetobacter baumannii]|nr:Uncharacterised protein [Acinetobacter baumannii]
MRQLSQAEMNDFHLYINPLSVGYSVKRNHKDQYYYQYHLLKCHLFEKNHY